MGILPAELQPVVSQDGFHLETLLMVKGQGVVVNDCHSCFRLFGSVQETKDEAIVGIYHHVQVDPSYPFEHTYVKSVLGEQFHRFAALHVLFPEAGIGFLNPGHLISGQFNLLVQTALFQLQQPFIACSQRVFVQNVLDGGKGDF